MAQDSDEHLTRYLLGELPEAEAESLDERSITDDEFAARLRALEDEIVDRHARGESDGPSRARFEQAHRTSSHLQKKLQFAEALHSWTSKGQEDRREPSTQAVAEWRRWPLAAAAIVLIATTGFLVRTNQRLRREFAHVETQRAVAEQQNAQLQRQLDSRPAQSAAPSAPVTATFLLPPPRRGSEREATIALKRDTTQVSLRLEVESDAYPLFWAALKDASSGAIVWRSPDVAAEPAGANRIATIVVPTEILRPQRYLIELTGVPKGRPSELLGAYPIRVIVQ